MSRKKFSKEFKLLKEHDEKGISYWKLGKEYGIEASIIRRWGYAYATFGESGLETITLYCFRFCHLSSA